jgi:hypothetical protein
MTRRMVKDTQDENRNRRIGWKKTPAAMYALVWPWKKGGRIAMDNGNGNGDER